MPLITFEDTVKLMQTDDLWYQKVFLYQKEISNIKNKRNKLSAKTILLKAAKFCLAHKSLRLGSNGYKWDQWRLPVDSIVIHHSSSSPTISVNEISAIHLLNLYVKQFSTDEDVINQLMYSGHYTPGKEKTSENMTFASYHYLIRPNGKILKLNENESFLWHAGNLDINRRSIGIVFAGKFIGKKEPTQKAIEAFKKLRSGQFSHIKDERIFGHKEVIKKEILGETSCPGDSFSNWKAKLIN
jgi:hypothetical protein